MRHTRTHAIQTGLEFSCLLGASDHKMHSGISTSARWTWAIVDRPCGPWWVDCGPQNNWQLPPSLFLTSNVRIYSWGLHPRAE